MKNVKRIIGKNIRTRRTAKGWSQGELARRAKCNWQQLSRIELASQNSKIETLAAIAGAFRIPIADLFQ